MIPIIQSINADTYRLDALRILWSIVDTEDILPLLELFSGPYKGDAIGLLRPYVRDVDVEAFTKIVDETIQSGTGITISGSGSRGLAIIGDESIDNPLIGHGNFAFGNVVYGRQVAVEKKFEYPDKLSEDTQVKEGDDKDVCAICADYYHRTINLPCMHACLCFHCAKIIGESEKKLCPVCRTPLEAIKTVFKS